MLLSPPRSKNGGNPTPKSPLSNRRTSNSTPIEVDTPPMNGREAKKIKLSSEIRVRITYFNDNDAMQKHAKHTMLLQCLANQDEGTITILNKRNENLKTAAIAALVDSAVHKNHFDVNTSVKGSPKSPKEMITIVQTFHTQVTLTSIKNLRGVMQCLRENKIQMTEHQWSAEDWDVKLIGFLPNFSPSHHPRETVVKTLNTKWRTNDTMMPQYRLRVIPLRTKVKGLNLRIQVYAVEVRTAQFKLANKAMKEHHSQPDEFISFRVKQIDEKAFANGIAITAQHQQDLRTVVVNNISEDAFFILEHQATTIENVRSIHHLKSKNSMRVIVYKEHFNEVRSYIKTKVLEWKTLLDPSDLRQCSGPPEVAYIPHDDISETSDSAMTIGIQSLLSVDLSELTIFQDDKTHDQPKEHNSKPLSDLTTATSQELTIIQKQQEIIQQQEEKIEALTQLIKDLKQDTDTKLFALMKKIDTMRPAQIELVNDTASTETKPNIPTQRQKKAPPPPQDKRRPN